MQLFTRVESITDALPYSLNTKKLDNTTELNKLNFTAFPILNNHKSYVPITGCVFEHITSTAHLSNLEKLFHLFINSLAFINNKTNTVVSRQRSVSLPSKTWAKLLNCSKSQIFSLQQSLERKGYLLITRDKNKYTQNKRNLLTPTLPDSVFKSLCKSPNKLGKDHLTHNVYLESKLEYLDRTKLFIPLNYGSLKVIASNEDLSPLQKVIWLDFYTKCYKCHISSNRTSGFSFITSYEELMERYECSRASLSKAMTVLENNNFIAKTRFFRKKDHAIEDRQDKSLWHITLSIPTSYNLELINTKDRTGVTITTDYLEKSNNDIKGLPISSEKISFNGNSVNYCNDKIDNIANYYINNILEEITDPDTNNNVSTNSLVNPNNNTTLIVSENDVDKVVNLSEIQDDISSPDPHVSKSSLHINKDLILKIKELKSNLRAKPKVIFNDFLKKFRKDDSTVDKETNEKKKAPQEFNICSELIREKLKTLPKDKADKARKFAYTLFSKKLAKGYTASLTKHELAKQLIHHAATWKPTKLGNISREKEIDTALSVAWKSIVGGTWQTPLEFAKAEVLNYEYQYYRKKYQESGVLSHEIKSLETEVNKLLGGWGCDLEGKIAKEVRTSDVTESNVPDITGVNISVTADLPLELALEKRDRLPTACLRQDLASEGSFFSGFNDKEHYHFDHDYFEPEEYTNRLNISLSQVPEDQKYLKVIPSDIKRDDSIRLEATDGKEYYVRLKELGMNDAGELVMTLKPTKYSMFLSYSRKTVPLLENNKTVIEDCVINTDSRPEASPEGLFFGSEPLLQQDSIEPEQEDKFFEDLMKFAKKGHALH